MGTPKTPEFLPELFGVGIPSELPLNTVLKYTATPNCSINDKNSLDWPKAKLQSDGWNTAYIMLQMETSCKLDLTYYPFDEQTCNIAVRNTVTAAKGKICQHNLLSPATKLRQGNVFTPVCDSVHGGWCLCPSMHHRSHDQGGLCPGGLCLGGGLCPGWGLCPERKGLCPGVSVRETPV